MSLFFSNTLNISRCGLIDPIHNRLCLTLSSIIALVYHHTLFIVHRNTKPINLDFKDQSHLVILLVGYLDSDLHSSK